MLDFDINITMSCVAWQASVTFNSSGTDMPTEDNYANLPEIIY